MVYTFSSNLFFFEFRFMRRLLSALTDMAEKEACLLDRRITHEGKFPVLQACFFHTHTTTT
jgi:hypothetical protein